MWSTTLLVTVLVLAAATLRPDQILAGSAFERFAGYTDRACASRQLRAITPGDLSWEQETFEDRLSPHQKKRLASANLQAQRCAGSAGGLSCSTTETLDAMRRTGILPAFGHFACGHFAPVAHLEEQVNRPTLTSSSDVRRQNMQLPAAATVAAAILQHLDLDSFPNSTGARRQPTLRTPADYGLIRLEAFDDGWVQVSEPDKGWYMSTLVLEGSREAATLCFRDTGGNGASYRATQVLHVQLQADARWTALQIADRTDCRNNPPLPPASQPTQDVSHGAPTFIPHHTMPPHERSKS